MAYYLYQGAYTAQALKALSKNPVNRFEVVRKTVEQLGGSLEGGWFAFGEYDFVLILRMPDNASAAALSLAVGAGGAVQRGKTTPLMTIDEGLSAFKKAGTSSYRPPGE
jgi:uncharacterized protein with GYD domain